MKIARFAVLFALACVLLAPDSAHAESPLVAHLKREILTRSGSFAGQGDPDFTRQTQLDGLVAQLVAAAPMPPVAQRLDLLDGVWKQVWGPYDYRNKKRGIDPDLGIDEIYQVVSKDGYYYNVSPLYKNGDRSRERIGLLRGEYKLDAENPNRIRVRFVRYPGVETRPADKPIWRLAAEAEAETLPDEITIVPTWVVWLFFGGGTLDEVYTDHDLRIAYSEDGRGNPRSLYVMTRVE